jgi:hypothetical protein
MMMGMEDMMPTGLAVDVMPTGDVVSIRTELMSAMMGQTPNEMTVLATLHEMIGCPLTSL